MQVWLDQAVLTPVAVTFFFGSMSVLEGRPDEAVSRIQAAYVPTLLRNWGVFIPTQIINFGLVPNHLRFVVVSVVSLFWNTYLSVANARQQRLQAETEAKAELLEDKKED
jgi:protein Mpv17